MDRPTFDEVPRGYDPRQVDDYLAVLWRYASQVTSRVAAAESALRHERDRREAEARIAESQAAQAGGRIGMMLAIAQQEADDIIASARQIAEAALEEAIEDAGANHPIVREAREQAEKLLLDAVEESRRLARTRHEEIEKQIARSTQQLEALRHQQGEIIGAILRLRGMLGSEEVDRMVAELARAGTTVPPPPEPPVDPPAAAPPPTAAPPTAGPPPTATPPPTAAPPPGTAAPHAGSAPYVPGQADPAASGPIPTNPAYTGPIHSGPGGPMPAGQATAGTAYAGAAYPGPTYTDPIHTGPINTGPIHTGPIYSGPAAGFGAAPGGPGYADPTSTGPIPQPGTGPTHRSATENRRGGRHRQQRDVADAEPYPDDVTAPGARGATTMPAGGYRSAREEDIIDAEIVEE